MRARVVFRRPGWPVVGKLARGEANTGLFANRRLLSNYFSLIIQFAFAYMGPVTHVEFAGCAVGTKR